MAAAAAVPEPPKPTRLVNALYPPFWLRVLNFGLGCTPLPPCSLPGAAVTLRYDSYSSPYVHLCLSDPAELLTCTFFSPGGRCFKLPESFPSGH